MSYPAMHTSAGHSLGAAVAMLCALRLHAQFPHPDGRHGIRCYTFGAPAIGNKALASWVSSAGFREDFHNFILPGGCIAALDISAAIRRECIGDLPPSDQILDLHHFWKRDVAFVLLPPL